MCIDIHDNLLKASIVICERKSQRIVMKTDADINPSSLSTVLFTLNSNVSYANKMGVLF